MPTQVTNYQCPACTGPLHFVGSSGKLECDYCGSKFDVSEIEALYAEKEQKAADAQKAAEEKNAQTASTDTGWDTSGLSGDWGQDAAGMKSYSCPSCGAELICDASTAATSCPYCGNPSVVPGQFTGSLKPDFVLPFKLSKDDAVKALKAHYKGKPFLPRAFTAENHVQEIKGVYVPFWMFDGEADGSAQYEATRSRSFTSGDYEVTETDHFDVYREGSLAFSRVPVDASSKMPDDYMDSIEPFDYDDLKPFSTAYLPGRRQRRPRRYPLRRLSRLRPCPFRHRLRFLCLRLAGREAAPRQGPLCAASGLDAPYQMERQGLPLCHERADRQARRLPSDQLRQVLGHLCCHRGRADRRAFRSISVFDVRRDVP